ncbi:hypothetical protein [Streptococcus castoreus]|uniref:hypothetical protein n=1 Tax=Streptococcus castoreus TaxID=254786 RepID=UPI0004077495|nr:hypothetical protein [Streptococcus castoreus]
MFNHFKRFYFSKKQCVKWEIGVKTISNKVNEVEKSKQVFQKNYEYKKLPPKSQQNHSQKIQNPIPSTEESLSKLAWFVLSF